MCRRFGFQGISFWTPNGGGTCGPFCTGIPDSDRSLKKDYSVSYSGFFQIRKKGKLPGQCTGVSYDLEYGSASVELQSNAFEFCQKGSKNSSSKARILVVDDLMATGGTMKAACDVLNAHVEAEVTHAFVVMELAFLQGKSQLPSSVNYHSLISYE